MKVIRVFKNNVTGELCRDKETVEKNGYISSDYKKYTDGKVKKIVDAGNFYSKDRKNIKKKYGAKNVMALTNGNYEKGLYTLDKNGKLKIWRLNPNDKKSFSKKFGYSKKGFKKRSKHYDKYHYKKRGVI